MAKKPNEINPDVKTTHQWYVYKSIGGPVSLIVNADVLNITAGGVGFRCDSWRRDQRGGGSGPIRLLPNFPLVLRPGRTSTWQRWPIRKAETAARVLTGAWQRIASDAAG